MGAAPRRFESGAEGREGLIAIWHYYLIACICALGIVVWRSPKRRTLRLALLIYVMISLVPLCGYILSAVKQAYITAEGDPQFIAGTVARIIIAQSVAMFIFLPIVISVNYIAKHRRTAMAARKTRPLA
jgi:hypothetical protein